MSFIRYSKLRRRRISWYLMNRRRRDRQGAIEDLDESFLADTDGAMIHE